jgi:two-component sensor histidine kinase
MMRTQPTAEPATFDFVGDDALLLHEFAHRTANEVAAAAAALRLANRAKPAAGARLMESAVWRLEAFWELNRMLARPVGRHVNVAADLAAVCGAIASGATAASRSEMRLNLPDTWIGGDTARRLVLVAVELVNNAVRHALDGRAGVLAVSLGVEGDDVVLVVSDDGAGVRPGARSSGTGLGRGIVSQLVNRGWWVGENGHGPGGNTVRVAFPLTTASDDARDTAF